MLQFRVLKAMLYLAIALVLFALLSPTIYAAPTMKIPPAPVTTDAPVDPLGISDPLGDIAPEQCAQNDLLALADTDPSQETPQPSHLVDTTDVALAETLMDTQTAEPDAETTPEPTGLLVMAIGLTGFVLRSFISRK